MFKVGDIVRFIAFGDAVQWERDYGAEINDQYVIAHVGDTDIALNNLNDKFAFYTESHQIELVNTSKSDCIPGCEKQGKHDTCHVYHPGYTQHLPLVKTENLGSVKHDQGKVDPTFLTWELIEGVCKVRAFGAKKYGRNNYKLTGFKFTRSLAAALRHIWAFLRGENLDPESGYSHIAHAICCLEHLLYDIKHHPNNDDRHEA